MSVSQLLNSDKARRIGFVLFVLALVPFAVYTFPQVVGANHGYVVLSDSMSPTIDAGDAVIVEDVDPTTIEQGDVITYRTGDDASAHPDRVTHRVVEVVEQDDSTYFRTKGDANEEVDQQLVPAEDVVGVVMFHIPLIGHVISFAGTDTGILVFVVVPSVLFIVSEVWDLWRAATAKDGDQ